MQFRLQYSTEARDTLNNLEQTDPKKYRKVAKTLALMENNLRHSGLQTHKFENLCDPNGEEAFEAYVGLAEKVRKKQNRD